MKFGWDIYAPDAKTRKEPYAPRSRPVSNSYAVCSSLFKISA